MEISRHTPGSFCWAELGTTDQRAAKRFYAELFGWGIKDVPMGPDNHYTILQLKGKDLGAIYQLGKEQFEQGIPPHWLSYVAVESADETAKAITAAGGRLIMDPFDVYDIGRMTIAQDPAGATFAIWQALKHIGAQIKDENNSMCWNELATRDAAAAKSFYGKVFGWSGITKGENTPYTEFYIGDPVERRVAGGMLHMSGEWGEIPPHWMVYFAVADCDATVERARSLGATICAQPTDIPGVGRFAVIRDLQDATFSVIRLTHQ